MTELSARTSNPAVEKALAAIPNLIKLGYRLLRDPRVPGKQKAFVGAALAYLIAPVDVIPDFIPLIGRADDLVILAFALNSMFEAAGEAIVHEHWDGTGDVLEIVSGVIEWGASLIPWPIRRTIKRFLRGF
jgi:uncharacterized membrane protein YkvA (DUF1232 family)